MYRLIYDIMFSKFSESNFKLGIFEDVGFVIVTQMKKMR